MSIRRFQLRVPSASRIGSGFLRYHELKFHKVSTVDGSAKCDAHVSNNPDHIVYGVLYRIAAAEKPALDQAEGLGLGYRHKDVTVELEDGAQVRAFCYVATAIDPRLKPFDWYREHVIKGARENNLPPPYIQSIEAVEPVPDGDATRRDRELSIYLPDR